MDNLYHVFGQLSDFQYRHFTPMIPNLFRDLWERGLSNKNFYLKLCGAGGGGFLLGITRDFSTARQYLGQYEIRPLFPF